MNKRFFVCAWLQHFGCQIPPVAVAVGAFFAERARPRGKNVDEVSHALVCFPEHEHEVVPCRDVPVSPQIIQFSGLSVDEEAADVVDRERCDVVLPSLVLASLHV